MRNAPLSIVLYLILFSCERCEKPEQNAPVDSGTTALQEKEPNDSAAHALLLEHSATVEANLGADPQKPDFDWYLFKATRASTVDVTVSGPPSADISLDIVDETGNVLISVNSGGPGVPERMPNLDVSAKTFVRVTGVTKGVGGAYALSAVFHERLPGYELEPNERKVDATPVALGQAISGLLSHPSDVDWYRYEMVATSADNVAPPPPADNAAADAGVGNEGSEQDAGTAPERKLALRVDLSGVEHVAAELLVLTEAEAVLVSAKSNEGEPLSLRNVGVRAADQVLYIAVKSAAVGAGKEARRGFNAETSYTLTVAPEEFGDSAELEPNDDTAHATEVPANSYREGFISPKGDVDVYRLRTAGPSLVQFQVTGVDKVDLVLSVIRPVEGKPDETVVKTNEGGNREAEQLNSIACDGVCFVRVEGAPHKVNGKWTTADENAEQSYRLNTLVVADDGSQEKESNNTAPQANALHFASPIRGTIYPKKDVDYFALDLRERPVKTALKATLTGILKVDVGLYLHRLDDEGHLQLMQTADSAKGERPEVIRFAAEPGLYVFEVRDSKNRESNFQDSYQLIVEEGEE